MPLEQSLRCSIYFLLIYIPKVLSGPWRAPPAALPLTPVGQVPFKFQEQLQMYKNNMSKICYLMQEMTKEKENKSESHIDNFV